MERTIPKRKPDFKFMLINTRSEMTGDKLDFLHPQILLPGWQMEDHFVIQCNLIGIDSDEEAVVAVVGKYDEKDYYQQNLIKASFIDAIIRYAVIQSNGKS